MEGSEDDDVEFVIESDEEEGEGEVEEVQVVVGGGEAEAERESDGEKSDRREVNEGADTGLKVEQAEESPKGSSAGADAASAEAASFSLASDEPPTPSNASGGAEGDEGATAPDILQMLQVLRTPSGPTIRAPVSPPEAPVMPESSPLQSPPSELGTEDTAPETLEPLDTSELLMSLSREEINTLAEAEEAARLEAATEFLEGCETIYRSFTSEAGTHAQGVLAMQQEASLQGCHRRHLAVREADARSEVVAATEKDFTFVALQRREEFLFLCTHPQVPSPPPSALSPPASPCRVLWNDSAACLCAAMVVLHAALAKAEGRRRLGWARRRAASAIQRCWRVDRAVTKLKQLQHRRVKMLLIDEERQCVAAAAVVMQSTVRRWIAARRTSLLKQQWLLQQQQGTAALLIQTTWKQKRYILQLRREARRVRELEAETAALRSAMVSMKQERQGLVKTIETLRRENSTLQDMHVKEVPPPPSPPASPPGLPVTRSVLVQTPVQPQAQVPVQTQAQTQESNEEMQNTHNDPLNMTHMSPQPSSEEREFESSPGGTSMLMNALEMARLKDQIILEQLKLLNTKTLSSDGPSPTYPLELQQRSAPVSPQEYEQRSKYKRQPRIRASTLAEVLLFNPRPARLGRRAHGRACI